MSSSTVATILTSGVNAISSNFAAILPVLIPAAVAIAIFFLAVHWFFNAAKRR